jgi:phospholipase/carboxylesterase
MLKTKLFQYEYIPAKNPGPEEKILLVFHGLGDSLDGFTWMPSQLKLDTLSYLLVNAPDDYYGGYSWFDFTNGGAFMERATTGIVRSRKLIRGLIQEMVDQGIKPGNILLFGFSQGCLMALDAGLRCDLILGGICGVSGWLAFQNEYPEKFSPVSKQQIFLVTHGRADPLLPFSVTKAQCEFLVAQGINLTFRAYDKAHTILPEELIAIQGWLQSCRNPEFKVEQ